MKTHKAKKAHKTKNPPSKNNSSNNDEIEYVIDSLASQAKETISVLGEMESYYRDHDKFLVETGEKMALFSAGIISLSITFLGHLISKNPGILKSEVDLLYASWIFLAANIVLSIIYRLTHSSLKLVYSTHENYYSQLEVSKKIIYFMERASALGLQEKIRLDTQVFEKQIHLIENKLIKRSSRNKKILSTINSLVDISVFTTFPVGISLLVYFAIVSSQLLIGKS